LNLKPCTPDTRSNPALKSFKNARNPSGTDWNQPVNIFKTKALTEVRWSLNDQPACLQFIAHRIVAATQWLPVNITFEMTTPTAHNPRDLSTIALAKVEAYGVRALQRRFWNMVGIRNQAPPRKSRHHPAGASPGFRNASHCKVMQALDDEYFMPANPLSVRQRLCIAASQPCLAHAPQNLQQPVPIIGQPSTFNQIDAHRLTSAHIGWLRRQARWPVH
jgi:hypothetical protein